MSSAHSVSEASVTYRLVGSKWHIRFRSRGRKEITRSLSAEFVTEKEIKREVSTYQRKIELEGWDPWKEAPVTSGASVSDAVNEYLRIESNRLTNKHSRQTLTDKIGAIVKALGSTDTPIALISQSQWQSSIGGSNLADTTIHNRAVALKAFLKWAGEAGYIGKDKAKAIIDNIASPRPKRRTSQHIPYDTFELILEKSGMRSEWKADFFRLIYFTGMRVSEAMAMKRSWVSSDCQWITVGDKTFKTKSGKNRTVPVPKQAKPVVERLILRVAGDRLFPDLSYRVVMQSIRRGISRVYGDDSGSHLVTHSLRHTYIINLIMAGFPLFEIIQYTGHSSVSVLERNYADWITRRDGSDFNERFKVL